MSLQPGLMGEFSVAPSHPSSSVSPNVVDGNPPDESHDEKPAPKRNACNTCRKRKLRCDGGTPACGRCTRLHHDCEYVERRRKSGPRRGYVKVLETRLAQVEGLLKNKDGIGKAEDSLEIEGNQYFTTNKKISNSELDATFNTSQAPAASQEQDFFSIFRAPVNADLPESSTLDDFSWDMIALGVDEPLPPQDTVDELTEIYFSKVHPTAPIIHQYRFYAAMNLSPLARPSASLRYAMWSIAASISNKYKHLHSLFYSRARKYIEADERSARQKWINIRHAQALLLVALYESKEMRFPDCWLTTGRASRMTQMMGLHRVDGSEGEAKKSLPIAMNWSEKEERRRIFWMAFCMDQYGSIATGWPVVIDERDIITNLPSSDEAFTQYEEVPGITLRDAMENPRIASKISVFGGNCIVASLSGSIIAHLHRPSTDNNDDNLNGHFWKNHRRIDSIILNTHLGLPSHLRLPAGLGNPNTVFLHMSLHAGTICLHQDAIFRAENVSAAIIAESKSRCFTAATELCSIMKSIAHMDLSFLNVYTPFLIYLAARVFGQIWKKSPEDDNAKSSLRFLLSALVAFKEHVPYAESHLIQLDLEGTGLTAMEGKVPSYSSVEAQMAGMSLRDSTDTTDDISYITFVTPLIRKVGSSSNNTPAPTVSLEKERSNPPTTVKQEHNRLADGADFFQQQPEAVIFPDPIDGFGTNENWDFGEVNLPPEMFDPAGMDMNFWNERQ